MICVDPILVAQASPTDSPTDPNEPRQRICEECGKPLPSFKNKGAKYCSNLCSSRVSNRRHFGGDKQAEDTSDETDRKQQHLDRQAQTDKDRWGDDYIPCLVPKCENHAVHGSGFCAGHFLSLRGVSTDRSSVRSRIPYLVEKYGGGCAYCSANTTEIVGCHVDHIWPYSLREWYPYGSQAINDDENLAIACASCNIHKQARPLSHWPGFNVMACNPAYWQKLEEHLILAREVYGPL